MTSIIDYAWACYAGLQDRNRKTQRLSSYSWGIEAGMTYLLDAIGSNTLPALPSELRATLKRTIASAARLHRSRSSALTYHALIKIPPLPDDPAAQARLELNRIARLVTTSDKDVLIDLGLGFNDREIADRRGTTPGAVRVRISRLRHKLAA